MSCELQRPVIRDTNLNIIYEFPFPLRLDGRPRAQEVPSTVVFGRHGAVTESRMMREEPREIILSGPLIGNIEQKDIREVADDILGEVAGQEVLLSRDLGETRYIKCVYININHTYEPQWAYTAADVSIIFRADDPFWYDLAEYYFPEDYAEWIQMPPVLPTTTDTESESFEEDNALITNSGNVEAYPYIIFAAEDDSIENVQLNNLTNGMTLEYNATINVGDEIHFETSKYTAADDGGTNVLSDTTQA